MYRVKEGIIGSAIGDALGISSKGKDRLYLLDNPVLKMSGNIKIGVPKGAWGDSTSIMIATMNAINKKGIDYNFIAENCVSWFTASKFCSVSESFGIDEITLNALLMFTNRKIDATICGNDNFESNTNSSLKMMLPIAFYVNANKSKDKEIYDIVKNATQIICSNEVSICANYIYVYYLLFLLNGNNKYAAIKKLRQVDYSMFDDSVLEYFSRILIGNIYELDIDEIKSTSFIVDTLESVLWCFLKSDNLKDCLIATANIGDDTSTIGALAGSIGGIYYGTNKIPKDWTDNLRKKEYLTELSEDYERYLRLLSYK